MIFLTSILCRSIKKKHVNFYLFIYFFCVQLTYFDRNSNQFFILEIFVYRKDEDQNRQNLANEGLDQILLVTFYIVRYSFQTVEI